MQRDMVAMMASRHLPTASAMPGTTLGVIPIPAFGPREKQLFDTAGVLIHHRLNALLDETELKQARPRPSLPPRSTSVILKPSLIQNSELYAGFCSFLW
jgi:hypothetical protein